MKLATGATPREPSDAEIRLAAYTLWLDSGRPASHDLELWFAAREMLCHQHAPPAQPSRGARSRPPRRPTRESEIIDCAGSLNVADCREVKPSARVS